MFKVTASTIDALYRYAKFQFECGNYTGAAEFLSHFRALNTDSDKNFSALWGKFAAEILTQEWENALKDMSLIKEQIDSKVEIC
jgi:translation initiation factor 3 subunit E